jgi:ubiquinone biosynthesis protein
VAAASLAQVHRAWLRADARPVALKVQYPEIQSLVSTDLVALRGLVTTIELLEPGLRLEPVLEHLEETLPLELDFGREAAAMAALQRALAHRSDVLIPNVVPELCTRRLLVMEYVDGVKITDVAALEQAGIDPRHVARLLNEVYAEQMLKLGWLHADPHPGNLRVQPGPRLVLLDHGLTVELRPALVGALRAMVGALARGDMSGLLEALTRVGFPVRAGTDISSLLQLAGVLLGSDDPADVGRRLGEAIGDVPSELVTVGRALSLLSGVTRTLDPELSVLDLVAASPTER